MGTAVVVLSLPAEMRLIAADLLAAICGSHSHTDRFKITRILKAELAASPRLIVVDEAQNLNRECIEFLRHLGEGPKRRGGMLLIGGGGTAAGKSSPESRCFAPVCFAASSSPH